MKNHFCKLLALVVVSFSLAASAADDRAERRGPDPVKFAEALSACEAATGVTLPRPPHHPTTDTQLEALKTCQEQDLLPERGHHRREEGPRDTSHCSAQRSQ